MDILIYYFSINLIIIFFYIIDSYISFLKVHYSDYVDRKITAEEYIEFRKKIFNFCLRIAKRSLVLFFFGVFYLPIMIGGILFSIIKKKKINTI